MLESKLSDDRWLDRVNRGAIEDLAEVEMARLVEQRPAVTERKRFRRGIFDR
jgi:hypothetical protein